MMSLNKLGYSWDISNFVLLVAVSGFAISKPAVSFVQDSVENIQDFNTSYSGNINNLFANNSSIGVLAICAAEGNCQIDGTKTSLYYSHIDPGNQRKLCISQPLQRLHNNKLTLFKNYTTITQFWNLKFLNLQFVRLASSCIVPVAPLRFLVQITSAIFRSEVFGL